MRSTFFFKITCTLLIVGFGLKSTLAQTFITVKNGHFKNGKSDYYYIGSNFWYGAILGAENGNRVRLKRELDLLKANGVNNLRILVGADGPTRASKVSPSLQTAAGVYNDDILAGLDYLLAEMGKRNMKAVLYLTNSWEWSGGYSQYLEWAGKGKAPVPSVDGWDTFTNYVAQFVECDSCKQLVKKHIGYILKRTNRYTKIKYVNDPAIMAWQIANEPRAFSETGKASFAEWIKETARYIKSIDNNHLVSTGSEGQSGSEGDINLWKDIHSEPAIDYLTIHIWPNNWGWLNKNDMSATLQTAITNTKDYLDKHLIIAKELNKPLVLEEFGLPRDSMKFLANEPTTLRDIYYKSIFEWVYKSAENHGVFAGCNFWAWGGTGRPANGHVFWQKGDDYLGDPAQEEQGLNSVFDTDTTVELIKQYNKKLNK
ncbi:glycoside hydrolase 5 family protein [Mucilaginibacter segetis]|uniref:mannan endo-1,4-beta-mannosidase n=1 Tax=Mucilaginibacter segetis TaxID=2793071 RepID=A0A934PUC0_9SPHI|nr:glycoside hydrolase family 2 TIM barrel-domain containing protein [Mucilaginibacter segetis]MBK0379722.1 cellulase family glycosylhydrolase [Mucilaginibacter segetis]